MSEESKPKRKRCEHGRQKSRCIDCGGISICEHRREKRRCGECGGSDICDHGRVKRLCDECGGSGLCVHRRQKSMCKDCGGSGLCVHRRQKSKCKDCGGGSNKRRRTPQRGNPAAHPLLADNSGLDTLVRVAPTTQSESFQPESQKRDDSISVSSSGWGRNRDFDNISVDSDFDNISVDFDNISVDFDNISVDSRMFGRWAHHRSRSDGPSTQSELFDNISFSDDGSQEGNHHAAMQSNEPDAVSSEISDHGGYRTPQRRTSRRRHSHNVISRKHHIQRTTSRRRSRWHYRKCN